MKYRLLPLFILLGYTVLPTCTTCQNAPVLYPDARPWTRLWWFADTTTQELIAKNLDYVKEKGFGGVECAFIYPYNRKDTAYAARNEWLSPAFIEKLRFAKSYADKLGMGFDLTFGTLWPFGDSEVPLSEATVCLKDSMHTDSMKYLWSHPKPGLVIDHLNKTAFRHYAKRLSDAFAPVLREGQKPPILFVDSWEVTSRYLGTAGFEIVFQQRYGYALRPYLDSLYVKKAPYQQVLYDYRKLVSEYILEHFYGTFTQIAHELGTYTRGQAAGAPCDIISAYAALDVPEGEALLYEAQYGDIPAAAAALSSKKIVSSETFTCLYGFPADHFKKEQTADLKLLADLVLAHGVNHIIWHGKPLARSEKDAFYASVHVGSDGALDPEMAAFNQYLAKVSAAMKAGKSYAKIAVYLPTEDAWVKGELPIQEQKIWSWGYYEMRENRFPEELLPWRPMWINAFFLGKGRLENRVLKVGDMAFEALYVDAAYLDFSCLETIVGLAEQGFPVIIKRQPIMPGLQQEKQTVYQRLLDRLYRCKNVHKTWKALSGNIKPLLTGNGLPDYWCRETPEGLSVFFAHPQSKSIVFPMGYGQSLMQKQLKRRVVLRYEGHVRKLDLKFEPYQSVLLHVGKDGQCRFEHIDFVPKTPQVLPRAPKKYERWEVDPAKYTGACH